jgi:hypothetical protein
LERCHGTEVKNTGGGLLATFDLAADANRCAKMIDKSSGELGLRIRAGYTLAHATPWEATYEGSRSTSCHASAHSPARARSSSARLSAILPPRPRSHFHGTEISNSAASQALGAVLGHDGALARTNHQAGFVIAGTCA